MKLLSIAVPLRDSEESICRCVESLLQGGEDVEIILVDDGSVDASSRIADEYAAEYPAIVRVIHQPREGYGECINTGILHATGLYFKVVGSEDWVDADCYRETIHTLRSLAAGGCMLDMMICNCIYEPQDGKKKKTVRYDKLLPKNQLFDWAETKSLKTGKHFQISSALFRTQLLRDSHLMLPKQSEYARYLYMYIPLPFVNTMYYLDTDLYHCTAREPGLHRDLPLTENMIHEQLMINKRLIDAYDIWKISNRHLRQYMLNYLEIMTAITTVMISRSRSRELLSRRKELWDYIKLCDSKLYHKLRQRIMGQTLTIPAIGGRTLSLSIRKK